MLKIVVCSRIEVDSFLFFEVFWPSLTKRFVVGIKLEL
jgi:hypothetical protein